MTAVLIWQRRKSRGAIPLALMMLSVVIWSFTSAFESVAITIPEKLFWSKAGYLGIASSAPLFYFFATQYTGYSKKDYPFLSVLIWIIPFFMFILAATNEIHHLIWTSVSFLPGSTILIYSTWNRFLYQYCLYLYFDHSIIRHFGFLCDS